MNNCLRKLFTFFQLNLMQLFSTNDTISNKKLFGHENIKKNFPQKLLICFPAMPTGRKAAQISISVPKNILTA